MFTSGIFHLIFLNHGWPWVIETVKEKPRLRDFVLYFETQNTPKHPGHPQTPQDTPKDLKEYYKFSRKQHLFDFWRCNRQGKHGFCLLLVYLRLLSYVFFYLSLLVSTQLPKLETWKSSQTPCCPSPPTAGYFKGPADSTVLSSFISVPFLHHKKYCWGSDLIIFHLARVSRLLSLLSSCPVPLTPILYNH